MATNKIIMAAVGAATIVGSGLALAPAAQAGDIVPIRPATRIVAQTEGAVGQLAQVKFFNYPIGCHLKMELKNTKGVVKKRAANMVDTPKMVHKTVLRVQIPADADGTWKIRSTVRGCSKHTTKTTNLTILHTS